MYTTDYKIGNLYTIKYNNNDDDTDDNKNIIEIKCILLNISFDNFTEYVPFSSMTFNFNVKFLEFDVVQVTKNENLDIFNKHILIKLHEKLNGFLYLILMLILIDNC